MSYQKIRPCPKCGSDAVSVYKYDSGWQYVECDGPSCCYRGTGKGSIKEAIKAHNAEALAPADRGAGR